METFHEMYFDEEVDIKGDMLDVLEYRHDWASFRFTLSLFKFFVFGMIPEVIMHTRSQGTISIHRHFDLTIFQMRSKYVTIMTAATTSTLGSSAHVWFTPQE